MGDVNNIFIVEIPDCRQMNLPQHKCSICRNESRRLDWLIFPDTKWTFNSRIKTMIEYDGNVLPFYSPMAQSCFRGIGNFGCWGNFGYHYFSYQFISTLNCILFNSKQSWQESGLTNIYFNTNMNWCENKMTIKVASSSKVRHSMVHLSKVVGSGRRCC